MNSQLIIKILICIAAGAGAGIATGFAGLSAVAFISPLLVVLLHMPVYQTVTIGLASDILASLISAVTYHQSGNIDLEHGKNMVGSFHQPSLVLCDPLVLRTLPEEEYRCGCAEIIKYGMIGSEEFFHSLSRIPVRNQVEDVVSACVQMKRRYVMEDERDTGLRMMLNFGHTFGHAAEACSHFSVKHGQGVAIGMSIISRAACKRGILSAADLDALLSTIRRYDLPSEASWSAEQMAETAASDKKASGASVRLIIPEKIGQCRIEKVSVSELRSWLRDGGVA